jgi:hypothetical protein
MAADGAVTVSASLLARLREASQRSFADTLGDTMRAETIETPVAGVEKARSANAEERSPRPPSTQLPLERARRPAVLPQDRITVTLPSLSRPNAQRLQVEAERPAPAPGKTHDRILARIGDSVRAQANQLPSLALQLLQ